MKPPVILTIIILLAGGFWGVRDTWKLKSLRAKHQQALNEAEELEIPTSSSKNSAAIRATRIRREEARRKAGEFANHMVAFAKEIQELKGAPDESYQKRFVEILDDWRALDAEELRALIEEQQGREDLDDSRKYGMIAFSLTLLAEKEPEATLGILFNSAASLAHIQDSKVALDTALFKLAGEQPLSALDWIGRISEKQPDFVSDDVKMAVVAGATQSDVALALQLIGKLNLSPEDGVNQIVRAASTPEKRAELLAALRTQAENAGDKTEAGKLFSAGMGCLLSQVSQSGYEKSMSWLQNNDLTSSEAGRMAEVLHYEHTKGDTGKWLDWLATKDVDGEKSGSAIGSLMQQWTEKDYVTAGEWLAQAPAGALKANATLAYLETVAPYEPEIAAQWAATLPVEKQKTALQTIYQTLSRSDRAAAASFAARHGLEVTP